MPPYESSLSYAGILLKCYYYVYIYRASPIRKSFYSTSIERLVSRDRSLSDFHSRGRTNMKKEFSSSRLFFELITTELNY